MSRLVKILAIILSVLAITMGLVGCNFFNGSDDEPKATQEPVTQAVETAMPTEQATEGAPLVGYAPPQEETYIDEYQAIAFALLEILMPAIQEMLPMIQAGMDADEIAIALTQDITEPGQAALGGVLKGITQDINSLIDMMVDAGFIVQFGLKDIFLLNQKLEDDSLLETIMFEAPRFINNQLGTVPIIANDERLSRWGGGIINRSNNTANPPITIYYFHSENMTALEAVVWSIERDIQAGAFMPGAWLNLGTIRSSDSFDMATGYFREELGLGMWRYWIYIAQDVPNTNDIVILDIIISPFHWNETQWGEYEQALLAELSRHINVDLKRFAP